MKKIFKNNKAFTLVEIVIAIAILSLAAIGIGAMIVGARNNSQKQFSESELQQQLVVIQESLRNDILSTNAGVKYWTDDGSGFATDSGASDSEKKEKLLAMYAVDFLDLTVTKTYIKYNADEHMLYKFQATESLEPDDDNKVVISEDIDDVLSSAQGNWDVYAQDISTFSFDFSKYSENSTVNYSVVTSSETKKYNSDNTVKVRNEIAVNEDISIDMPDTDIVVAKPVLEKSRFEYNGQLRTPNEVSINSRYIEKSGVTSATDAGVYEIVYSLKNELAIWSDGTKQPYTVRWTIEKRQVSVTWGTLSWVYDGQTQRSTTVSLGNVVPGDTCEPQLSNNIVGPDVGTSIVTLTLLEPEGKNNYTVYWEDAENTISIVKAGAKVSKIPTARDLTYTGSAQELITKGETSEGTLVYSLNRTGPFTTNIPTGTESNNETPYVVYYQVQGDANHDNSAVDSLEVIIKKAAPTVTAPQPLSPILYNAQPQVLIKAGSSNGGEMVYNVAGGNFSTELPTGIRAGVHKVGYKSLENSNYKESATGYVDAIISKSDPIYTVPVGIDNLVYNGQSQALVVAGTAEDGAWEYNVDGGEWSTDIPAKIFARDNYVVGYRLPETEDYEAVEAAYLNVSIEKAPAKCVPPVPKEGLIYNAIPQTLISDAQTNDGTVYYGFAADKEFMTQELPSGLEARDYTIYYYVMGDDNHYDSGIESVVATIGKAQATVSLLPQGVDVEYCAQYVDLLSFVGQPEGGNGTMVFTLTPQNSSTWSEEIPQGMNAGVYNVYYKVIGNENFSDSAVCSVPIKSTISQVTNTITAPLPIESLVYNGTPQRLIIPGSTKYGEMQYSTDKVNWSKDIPTRIDAGNYVVYYRVETTADWTGVEGSVDCYIDKATIEVVSPDGFDLQYNGSNQVLIQAGSCNPGKMFYRLEGGNWSQSLPTAMDVGTYLVEYKADAGSNYHVVTDTVTAVITSGKNEATPPTAKELTFGGLEQRLIDPGTPKWGEMEYSLDNTNWSTEIPVAVNAGMYTVFWRVPETENYRPELGGTVNSTINHRLISAPYIEESDKQLKYSEAEQTPAIVYDHDWVTPSGDLSGTDVDKYIITFTLNDADNTKWADGTESVSRQDTWEIIKVKAYYTVEPIGLDGIYDTLEHALIDTLGESSTGTVKYRMQGGSEDDWAVSSPVATNANTYYVECKIFGDSNHDDSDILTVTAVINKAPIVYEALDVEFDYDGNEHCGEIKISQPTDDIATITYGTSAGQYTTTEVPMWKDLGVHTTYFKIEAENYITVESSYKVTIEITKENMPTGVNINYDGKEHVLLLDPEEPMDCTTCRLEYGMIAPDSGSDYPTQWSKEYPKATEAGDYYIFTRIAYFDSNGNVTSTEDANTVHAHIRPINTIFTVPLGLDRIANEEYQTIHTPGYVDYGHFIYQFEPTGEDGCTADENGILISKDIGTYDFSWSIQGDNNHLDFPSDDEYAYHSDVTIKQYEEP